GMAVGFEVGAFSSGCFGLVSGIDLLKEGGDRYPLIALGVGVPCGLLAGIVISRWSRLAQAQLPYSRQRRRLTSVLLLGLLCILVGIGAAWPSARRAQLASEYLSQGLRAG